jgi:hypothetical protein
MSFSSRAGDARPDATPLPARASPGAPVLGDGSWPRARRRVVPGQVLAPASKDRLAQAASDPRAGMRPLDADEARLIALT